MTKLNDEEIQQLLDRKLSVKDADKKDLAAYQFVFDTLSKKPAEGLPLNFAAKVSSLIQVKADRHIAFGWYVLFPIFLLAVFIAAYFYLSHAGAQYASVYSSLLSKYKWAFFFGAACFVLVEYLDRKMVNI